MHNVDLILTLTSGLSAALVLGYITHRLGLSPIVGYLLAGTLVGPQTPGFVANAAIAEQLAEVGVILLMFGVGLQFRVEELLAVRRIAVPGAVGQSLIATVLGTFIAHGLGWSWSAGFVYGMALAVASTVVLIRVLADHKDLHTPVGHIAVGWLVVEDLFTVLAVVLLPALFRDTTGSSGLLIAVGLTVLKVAALVAFAAVVGTRVIPRVLDHVATTGSRELFTLTVLALALGIAVGSSLVFGVSMALGAFLAGLIVGRSDYSVRAASEALPMRDAFAVLFFVAVGMLLDPRALIASPALVAATLIVVLVGKPAAALAIVRLLGYPFKISLSVAVALAQVGEFSFILSNLGRDLKLLTHEATNSIVAVSIISIVLNPILYRTIPAIDRFASRSRWSWLLNPRPQHVQASLKTRTSLDTRPRAVIVGSGPTGRTMTRLLIENGIEPVVIDLNMDTIRDLRDRSVDAVYGDASHRETLEAAGVATAQNLILTSAGMGQTGTAVIQMARELNPKIRVLARAAYLRDLAELHKAGADEVLTGEGEVALALTETILQRLGATPDQIDRERRRARTELFGDRTKDSATSA